MSHKDETVPKNLAPTAFTPTPPPNPGKPDVVSEGKIISGATVAGGASVTSKSARVIALPGHVPTKTIYVESDKLGSFVIEVLLDESEFVGGNPVWRKLAIPAPITVTGGSLAKHTFTDLFRQVRIVFTADSGITGNATVNSWIFSVA